MSYQFSSSLLIRAVTGENQDGSTTNSHCIIGDQGDLVVEKFDHSFVLLGFSSSSTTMSIRQKQPSPPELFEGPKDRLYVRLTCRHVQASIRLQTVQE
jgi:hypothetical protein